MGAGPESIGWIQWIQWVEIPVIGALAGWVWRLWQAHERLARDIMSFRLHVANEYVSAARLKEVEDRLHEQLRRVEHKLDELLLDMRRGAGE